MTYRQFAYDIKRILKSQGDDADIGLAQIVYWTQLIGNRLVFEDIEFSKKITSLYDATYKPIPVKIDTVLDNRKYIDLPSPILHLKNEGGVTYISYNMETCCCDGPAFAQKPFTATTKSEAERIYGDEYEKPSPKNPYFYFVGKVNGTPVNRLYFLGLDCVNLKDVEICIKQKMNPANTCDIDEQMPIAAELLQRLQAEVLQIGRFMINMPEERINEGSDERMMAQFKPPQVQPQQQQASGS